MYEVTHDHVIYKTFKNTIAIQEFSKIYKEKFDFEDYRDCRFFIEVVQDYKELWPPWSSYVIIIL